MQANRNEAQFYYREAITLDPALADSHRGLGMLYQDEDKSTEAFREYQLYLDLAPSQAPDRLRIQRRVEALKTKLEGTRK